VADVRFGSLADIGGSNCDVRYTPLANIAPRYSITSSVRAAVLAENRF
jgi:hypothetical protein